MMIIKEREVKLANEYTTTRRNPDLNSGIYLTTVKVAQCRQVADNSTEKLEGGKLTENNTATRKVYIQLNRSGDFDKYINPMNSLSLSTTSEERLIQIIQK